MDDRYVRSDTLFIKYWQAADQYNLTFLDTKDTVLLNIETSASEAPTHVLEMLELLSKKGLNPTKIYIPLWSSFQDIVAIIFPRAKVYIDYNE